MLTQMRSDAKKPPTMQRRPGFLFAAFDFLAPLRQVISIRGTSRKGVKK